MKKSVKVVVSSAAGNVTVIVLDPFEREDYKAVASQLLAMEELGGEQVGFVKEADIEGCRSASGEGLPSGEAMGRLEMCGLEFCGNATRSFAVMLAAMAQMKGTVKIPVRMSGADGVLTVEADMDSGIAKVRMPDVLSVKDTTVCGIPARAADMGGILHIVMKGVSPSEELFDSIKKEIYSREDPPALGVMFTDETGENLTPVVYVKDVDTTYFEGSCGSGTTACAAVFSADRKDGVHRFRFRQPAGTIDAEVRKRGGAIEGIWVESPVTMSEVKTVEIDV